MQNYFFYFLETEISNSIPTNWKMVASEKLLGKAPCKIRYAFNSSNVDGQSKLINILAFDKSTPPNEQIEKQITSLRDYIISKNCLLIVICELENFIKHSVISSFVSQTLSVLNENFYAIYLDDKFQVVNTDDYIKLSELVHDIWSGEHFYFGPKAGSQKVNIEIMKDRCWKCEKEMKTVTGIVFPDVQKETWDNLGWSYFNSLVPLSAIKSEQAETIKKEIDLLRQRNFNITPISYSYSNTTKTNYLAAHCPHCNSLRGDFHVNITRLKYLHNLDSRIEKSLDYCSIELNIEKYILEQVINEPEISPFSCPIAWI